LLNRRGHLVQLAHDGPSALAAARAAAPNVVLLDIGLPGMTGYDVARHLRSEPACSRTLVVALSGYGQEEDRRRSKEAGFHHHLVKPVDFEQVNALISAHEG
jgi:CheY-like chemotaxis protein